MNSVPREEKRLSCKSNKEDKETFSEGYNGLGTLREVMVNEGHEKDGRKMQESHKMSIVGELAADLHENSAAQIKLELDTNCFSLSACYLNQPPIILL
jgi:hypothetical protein